MLDMLALTLVVQSSATILRGRYKPKLLSPEKSRRPPAALRRLGRSTKRTGILREPLMRSATLIGFTAILMWSLLSLLTVASGSVPPFQLAAMTFAIGGAIGAATWLFRPGAASALKQPWQVWALGVGGLFGYHALYFLALRLAPPAEAQLVSYLWPVLIVLLSATLPGKGLRLHHVAGALIAACGTAVLFAGRGVTLTGAYLPG